MSAVTKTRSAGPVRVHAMTIWLTAEQEPHEWFAACVACQWFGSFRSSIGAAKTDAARHRRTHVRANQGETR